MGFRSTHWSLVLRAGDASDPQQREAFEQLCRAYWEPLYVYIRRKGHTPHDAQDLTQSFFAYLIEKALLDRLQSTGGRFRAWLLQVLEHFLANQHRIRSAARRGGGQPLLSFDTVRVERGAAGWSGLTPEAAYNRAWGLTVLQQAWDRLREAFAAEGRESQLDVVREHLNGQRASYEELAARMGLSVSQVTNLLHRTRRRLEGQIRAVLAETVDGQEDLAEELSDLFGALSGE